MYDILRFAHILTVVFMAAPLYNLVAVSERVRFGKAPLQVDQYFENLIRGNSTRCYIFQVTALVTGILLVMLGGSLVSLITNWVLLVKLIILFALMGLLSVVHFSIQPAIDALVAQATGDAIPQSLAVEIAPLRIRRKRLASLCLFLVVATVLLGLQVYSRFGAATMLVLLALAGIFAWRVYRSGVVYGWL